MEPKLVGRHLGLDPLITLMALYAGYKLWGIGGMILAPMLAVTATQIVPERKKDDTFCLSHPGMPQRFFHISNKIPTSLLYIPFIFAIM